MADLELSRGFLFSYIICSNQPSPEMRGGRLNIHSSSNLKKLTKDDSEHCASGESGEKCLICDKKYPLIIHLR